MVKHKILIGSDPEVFMVRKTSSKAVSAHGVIPGTKDNPHKVKRGAVQVDGMALEFNIDPAKSEKEFIKNINEVMGQLRGMLPVGFDLDARATAHFSSWYMKRQPKEAKELGCDPDFNAWKGGDVNPRPNANVNFRTGAGHVHIGWTKDQDVAHPEHMEACCILTRELDVYLGLASLLYDGDTERRTLYGSPGAFRPKSYGCEYRVLSNAWLKDEKLMGWVYQQVHRAWDNLMKGERISQNCKHLLSEMNNPKPDTRHLRWVLADQGVVLPPKV